MCACTHGSSEEGAHVICVDLGPFLGHLICHSAVLQRRQALASRRRLRLGRRASAHPRSRRNRHLLGAVLPLAPVMGSDALLGVNLHPDPQVTRILLLLQDLLDRAVRKPVLAHPPQMLRAQVRLGHDAKRLAKERQAARAALRDADQVHGRRHTLDNGQRRQRCFRRAERVARQRIAAAARHVRDGDRLQGPPGVRAQAQPTEDLVRPAIAAARRDDVERVNVHVARELDGLARARRRVHRHGHARRREERLHFLRPLGLGTPRPCVWVDEDVGAFAAGGGPVGAGEEGFGPFRDGVGGRQGVLAVARGSRGVGELDNAQLGLGDVLGVVDGQRCLVLSQLGPEDVVKRYRACLGRA